MPRPKSDGLLYFSFDTDFFYSDKRIKALRARYGCDGLVIYIYLLTEIYRNGYFIWWDEESEENMMADLNLSEGLIKQVIAFLISRSLLYGILVNSDTALTSPGIQKRYQEAVKGLKRDIFVQKDLWLLDESKTATCIKFTKKYDNSEKNDSKSEKNESKSEKNSTKEMKRNETKKDNKTLCKADAYALFERLWKLYPSKKGKGQVSDVKKRKLLEIGFDEMSRAIERYKAELKKDSDWRKPQNGSTFFNSGYIDYLDDNYVPGEHKRAAKKDGGFNDFSQRTYDYDALEKILISN